MYIPPEKEIEKKLEAVYTEIFSNLGRFKGSFIAGGSITSLVLGEEPNDYDIWFETVADWENACHLARRAVGDFNEGPVTIICETEHALTFKLLGMTPVLQFVKSRTGAYDEVIEQFDFLHAQAAYLPSDEDGLEGELLFGNRNCIDFIKEKVLVFEGKLDYPIHTLSRLQKFAKRGWIVPDQTLACLIREIRRADQDLIDRDQNACGMKYGGEDYLGAKKAALEAEHKIIHDPETQQCTCAICEGIFT
jgi:hypothetical protein